jgi:hypothetical protein
MLEIEGIPKKRNNFWHQIKLNESKCKREKKEGYISTTAVLATNEGCGFVGRNESFPVVVPFGQTFIRQIIFALSAAKLPQNGGQIASRHDDNGIWGIGRKLREWEHLWHKWPHFIQKGHGPTLILSVPLVHIPSYKTVNFHDDASKNQFFIFFP